MYNIFSIKTEKNNRFYTNIWKKKSIILPANYKNNNSFIELLSIIDISISICAIILNEILLGLSWTRLYSLTYCFVMVSCHVISLDIHPCEIQVDLCTRNNSKCNQNIQRTIIMLYIANWLLPRFRTTSFLCKSAIICCFTRNQFSRYTTATLTQYNSESRVYKIYISQRQWGITNINII